MAHLGATLLEGPPSARDDKRIVVCSLSDAHRLHPALLAGVRGKIARRRAGRFVALATAFQNCGVFVYVPPDVVVQAPIQLVWMHGAGPVQAVFPHIVVLLGSGAQATIIERHVGEADTFVCGIVEAHVEAGAHLEYALVQQCGDGARMRMTRAARCEGNAQVGWHLAELGGAQVRTALDAHLDVPGARAELTELFLNTGVQRTEIASMVDHRSERTFSGTVVRCAANDRSRGGYVGSVRIRAEARESDGSLRADALLLSKRARVDVKPELEIRANDVSAFHGATVGSLDEESLFYVQTRGIPRSEAIRLITLAFFEPAVARFPGAALQDEIRTALDHKIDEATEPAHTRRSPLS
jgi:Fe-S cluster assembly protein SufD